MGDSVDNVPGVPGVGPKTASELIRTYGSLEAVLAAAPEIKKPKLRENLIAHADNARLSRELVRLVCDSHLPEPLDALQLTDIPPEPLKQCLADQVFRSRLTQLDVDIPPPPASPEPREAAHPPLTPEATVAVTES